MSEYDDLLVFAYRGEVFGDLTEIVADTIRDM